MQKLEIRLNEVSLESVTTSETDTDLVVEGYVNETGKWSHQMRSKKGPFIEKIMPGAFNKALKNGNDIHFLAEHDSNKILSSTRNDSLTLTEDEKGLKMKASISKTSYGKDYYQLIKDGILRNMSFGFFPIKDTWKKNAKGILERSISELALFEVSVVTNPAYPTTAISARGLDVVDEVEVPDFEEETMEEKRNEEVTQEVTEIEKKEETEERAYVSSIWSSRDLLSECLTIQEKILTVVNHHSQNTTTSPFKDSDIKAFKNAYKVLSTCMMSIAEPTVPAEDSETQLVRNLEETKETENVSQETVEETKVEETKEEERSVDPLQAYRDRLSKLKENK